MDVLQKEIDEVYATQPIAHETLNNETVEQHRQFILSLTEINGGCAVISDLSNRKSNMSACWSLMVRQKKFQPHYFKQK